MPELLFHDHTLPLLLITSYGPKRVNANHLKVAVAMSGGIDSSVTVAMLHACISWGEAIMRLAGIVIDLGAWRGSELMIAPLVPSELFA